MKEMRAVAAKFLEIDIPVFFPLEGGALALRKALAYNYLSVPSFNYFIYFLFDGRI